MLLRNPLGGSLVIFTPFCNTRTGKWSAGYDVNQSLKSGWVASGVRFSQICKFKHISFRKLRSKTTHTLSKVGIKLLAKWQFCNTTHVPFLTPSSISRTAIGPWPWPRDNGKSLAAPKPWSSANLNKTAVGSAPGVNMKINGIQQWESA